MAGCSWSIALRAKRSFIAIDQIGLREDFDRGLELKPLKILVAHAPGPIVFDANRLVVPGDFEAPHTDLVRFLHVHTSWS